MDSVLYGFLNKCHTFSSSSSEKILKIGWVLAKLRKFKPVVFFVVQSRYAIVVLGIIILSVLCHQQRLVGDVPFHLKFALKVTYPPFEKRRLRQMSAYNVSTVRASEKCSIFANRKSATRFPTSYRWSAYVTPNPQSVAQKPNLSFLWVKFKFNRIKCATKFLYVRTSSGKIVEEPFSYPTVYTLAVNVIFSPEGFPPSTNPISTY